MFVTFKSYEVSDCGFCFLILTGYQLKDHLEGDPFNFFCLEFGYILLHPYRISLYLNSLYNRELITKTLLFRHIWLIEYVYTTCNYCPCLVSWGFMDQIQFIFHSSVFQAAGFLKVPLPSLSVYKWAASKRTAFSMCISDHAELDISMITSPRSLTASSEWIWEGSTPPFLLLCKCRGNIIHPPLCTPHLCWFKYPTMWTVVFNGGLIFSLLLDFSIFKGRLSREWSSLEIADL